MCAVQWMSRAHLAAGELKDYNNYITNNNYN